MFKFNSDNLVTGFIKELLKDFNLPSCRVYKEGTTLHEGCFYVKDFGIYECKNNALVKRADYIFGDKVTNFTTNFIIKTSEYDFKTHEYLGDYLRFIRDYKGINLMPLYNCYDGLVEELYYVSTNPKISFDTSDENFEYYSAKVKFDETYTLGIDSPLPYEVALFIDTSGELSDISKELIKVSYKKIHGSSFKNPAFYSTKLDQSKLPIMFRDTYIRYENNLKLVIKIPKSITTSISVLEGDYRLNTYHNGAIVIPRVNGEVVTTTCTKLSLLRASDGESYAFADRLIEYLAGQVITKNDELATNIARIQKTLYKNATKFYGVYDIWDNYLSRFIYDGLLKKNKKNLTATLTGSDIANVRFIDSAYDLLGDIDKNTEVFENIPNSL